MVAILQRFSSLPRFIHSTHMLKPTDIVKYTARHAVYTGLTGEIMWIDEYHINCHVRVIAHPTIKRAAWLLENVERA
jgi:hypothetical protein